MNAALPADLPAYCLPVDAVLTALRTDPALSKVVSTVDNVSGAAGQLVTVLALIDQLGGHPGHYGIGSGASGLAPRFEKR